MKQMASGFGDQSMEANYIYNSSGAISVNVNDAYWDQTITGNAAG